MARNKKPRAKAPSRTVKASYSDKDIEAGILNLARNLFAMTGIEPTPEEEADMALMEEHLGMGSGGRLSPAPTVEGVHPNVFAIPALKRCEAMDSEIFSAVIEAAAKGRESLTLNDIARTVIGRALRGDEDEMSFGMAVDMFINAFAQAKVRIPRELRVKAGMDEGSRIQPRLFEALGFVQQPKGGASLDIRITKEARVLFPCFLQREGCFLKGAGNA